MFTNSVLFDTEMNLIIIHSIITEILKLKFYEPVSPIQSFRLKKSKQRILAMT